MSDIKYKEGLDSIINGINKTVDAVKSTFGPNGNTVFIKDRNRLINTKDGVTVARFINLDDPFENIGAMLVKEVSERSNSEVGDGPQPLYSKVLTPNGWVKIGDLKIGDKVCGTNKSIQTVLGVFDKGEKDVYQITIGKDRKVLCSGDHVWTLKKIYCKDKKQYTVNKILEDGITTKSKGAHKYYVPISIPEFTKQELPLNPYLIGVLLGDGSLTDSGIEICIGYNKKHIIPDGVKFNLLEDPKRKCFRIKISKSIIPFLKEAGIFGLKSKDKYIPEKYLFSDYNDRIELLNGLLDTDGHINKKGLFEFSTISEKMYHDFLNLIYSLGYNAWHGIRNRTGNSYSSTAIFRIYQTKGRKHGLPITNIEKLNTKEKMVCIKVSNEDHLYYTDNFVLTHNTTGSAILIQSLVNKIQDSLIKYDKKYLLEQLNEIENYLLNYLYENKIDIDIENIKDVALIASNGDKDISDLLYSIFKTKGKNVDIRLEKIDEKGLFVEYSNGYTINRGYASPLFINNPSQEECFLKNPDVIIYPKEVNSLREIANILEYYTNPTTPVVFMCNYMNPQTIADISKNNMNQLLECLVVQTPINNNEDDMKDLLSVISAEKENDYYIGSVDAVSSRCQYTTFIKNKMNNEKRIKELSDRLNINSISKYDKEKIISRINQLQGGAATIRIGANSNVEQKEIQDRVEDAVKACQAAFRNGVVPGGGYFLAKASFNYDSKNEKIFTECFRSPFNELTPKDNEFIILQDNKTNTYSYKIVNGNIIQGDCLELGIIDPVEVIENEIKNSVSVARSVLTNKVSINND